MCAGAVPCGRRSHWLCLAAKGCRQGASSLHFFSQTSRPCVGEPDNPAALRGGATEMLHPASRCTAGAGSGVRRDVTAFRVVTRASGVPARVRALEEIFYVNGSERYGELQRFFEALWSQPLYRKVDPRSLRLKHIAVVLAQWRSEGLSPNTLRNRVS